MVESNPVVAAEYKVVVIGEYSTGKTSIINRFVENDFSFQTMTTIGEKNSISDVFKRRF